MKKVIISIVLAVLFIAAAAAPAKAQSYSRKGRFQVGLVFPSIFFGNKNIDAMLSGAVEGEYFLLENLSLGFRIEGASDFKMGDSPHSVFLFDAKARYIFDIDDNWKAYLGLGGGVALLGSSTWAGDVNIPNVGGYYQFNDHISFGVDANMHVLLWSRTAFAFSLGPSFRWMF